MISNSYGALKGAGLFRTDTFNKETVAMVDFVVRKCDLRGCCREPFVDVVAKSGGESGVEWKSRTASTAVQRDEVFITRCRAGVSPSRDGGDRCFCKCSVRTCVPCVYLAANSSTLFTMNACGTTGRSASAPAGPMNFPPATRTFACAAPCTHCVTLKLAAGGCLDFMAGARGLGATLKVAHHHHVRSPPGAG